MEINTSKLLAAFLLAFFRFSCVHMPISIYNIVYGKNEKKIDDDVVKKRLERFELCRTIFRSFGSGVFLCTCLVHLMPSVVQLISDGYKNNQITKDDGLISALAQFYICIGFFVIYFIEEFCHWTISKVPTIPIGFRKKLVGAAEAVIDTVPNEQQIPDRTESSEETIVSYTSWNAGKKERSPSKTIAEIFTSMRENSLSGDVSGSSKKRNKFVENEKDKPSQRQVVSFVFSGTGVVLHALFEGIAIGLQHKEASNVWFLTMAMMIHSATSLFCVGMKFLAMGTSRRSIIVHFIIQALASPAGILVGYSILVGGKLEKTMLIDGYFEALSTGTILYITFFEALSKEKQMRVLRICRGTAMVTGFGVMCVLEYFVFLEKSVFSREYYGDLV